MFSHTRYVPVLRFKESERLALLNLSMKDRHRITPLFELSPNLIEPKPIVSHGKIIGKREVQYDEVFPGIIDQIQQCWGKLPFFVDFELLERVLVFAPGKHPANMVCDSAILRNMPMTLVTGLNRPTEYDYVVREYNNKTKKGIGLRLTTNDLRDNSLISKINMALSNFDLPHSYVDLFIDLKLIHQNYFNFRDIISVLPKIDSWRTFTVISGAFPKDLSDLEKNQEHEIERSDYDFWFKQIQQPGIERTPSFGDYTIQHPFYDYNPPPFPNVSASIRYTSDDYWVIMRGEGLRNDTGAGFGQYWAQAMMLCNRNEYCGKDFSYGDTLIFEMANRINNVKGNPRITLRAGINHHLVYTVKQISKMFGISDIEEPKDGLSLGPQPRRGASKQQRGALSERHQPFLFPQER